MTVAILPISVSPLVVKILCQSWRKSPIWRGHLWKPTSIDDHTLLNATQFQSKCMSVSASCRQIGQFPSMMISRLHNRLFVGKVFDLTLHRKLLLFPCTGICHIAFHILIPSCVLDVSPMAESWRSSGSRYVLLTENSPFSVKLQMNISSLSNLTMRTFLITVASSAQKFASIISTYHINLPSEGLRG